MTKQAQFEYLKYLCMDGVDPSNVLPNSFTYTEYRELLKLIKEHKRLYKGPVRLITLEQLFNTNQKIDQETRLWISLEIKKIEEPLQVPIELVQTEYVNSAATNAVVDELSAVLPKIQDGTFTIDHISVLAKKLVKISETHPTTSTSGIRSAGDEVLLDKAPVIRCLLDYIDNTTNLGGIRSPFLGVILSLPKSKKTTLLIEIAKTAFTLGLPVFWVDTENGQDSVLVRFYQSLANITEEDYYERSSRTWINYFTGEEHPLTIEEFLNNRLAAGKKRGGDFKVESFKNLSTNMNQVAALLNSINYHPALIIVDDPDKLVPIVKSSEERKNYRNIYQDIIDFNKEFNSVAFVPSQINRAGFNEKWIHIGNIGEDIGKIHNATAAYALHPQQDEEKELDIVRFSVIAQRYGEPPSNDNYTVFKMLTEIQRVVEIKIDPLEALQNKQVEQQSKNDQ